MFILFGRGTRKIGPIYPIFTPHLALEEILGRAKFEKNRLIISHFIRIIGIQNFKLFTGEAQEEKWSDPFHLHIRSSVDRNIYISQVRKESEAYLLI